MLVHEDTEDLHHGLTGSFLPPNSNIQIKRNNPFIKNRKQKKQIHINVSKKGNSMKSRPNSSEEGESLTAWSTVLTARAETVMVFW